MPILMMESSYLSKVEFQGTGLSWKLSNENDSFSLTDALPIFNPQLMEKVRCIFYGYYQNADYETSIREDDRWLVSLTGEYMFNDYFTFGLSGSKQ